MLSKEAVTVISTAACSSSKHHRHLVSRWGSTILTLIVLTSLSEVDIQQCLLVLTATRQFIDAELALVMFEHAVLSAYEPQ